MALAVLPALAYLGLLAMNTALGGREPDAQAAAVVQSLRCLSAGFIVTGLLWASALASLVDGRLLRAAGYLAVAGVCSLFGVIHSPLVPAVIAMPGQVITRMNPEAALLCQSPYHWAAAYWLAAAVLVVLAGMGGPTRKEMGTGD